MERRKLILLIVGILLIVFGILLAVFLIKVQYDDCVHRWSNNLNGFGYKYTSVWNCFIERSTGAIIFSVLIGMLSVVSGFELISKR